jgi:epoxyqueuosine reductase
MGKNMKLSQEINEFLREKGASLVGFADVSALPAAPRFNLPRAVAFAVALDPKIVAAIKDGPTLEYYEENKRVNTLLGELSLSTAALLKSRGFSAISSAATKEGVNEETLSTELPHKTVATLAGIGWIGKCALLISEEFGSAIRLNRVLTDAALSTGIPITESSCGECRLCVDKCPGSAVNNNHWAQNKRREALFDAFLCRRTALESAYRRTGISEPFCGICIAVCPWTLKYISRSTKPSH